MDKILSFKRWRSDNLLFMAAMFIEECSLKKISSEKKAVVWKSV
jgi:hypothetical protein